MVTPYEEARDRLLAVARRVLPKAPPMVDHSDPAPRKVWLRLVTNGDSPCAK